MSGNDINRRDFLKFMGLGGAGAATLSGCDMPTTVTLEEGKEEVVSYMAPEEYVIPGIGVWYASTCQQCPSGCGVHGRVREGRVLKLEGNPDSPVNTGVLCQMGQASLQGHYNPDRITKPMVRKGGSLTEVSWDEALGLINDKVSAANGKVAMLTGAMSGHQAELMDAYLANVGGKDHFVYETINNAVAEAVNAEMLGSAQPRYNLDKAGAVLSFGADFLGTWVSPMHFSQQYAKFRSGDRGVLMVVEPSMSLTGGSADVWVPAKPGTEGVIALGIANVLITKKMVDASVLPAAARDTIAKYSVDKVTAETGVAGDTLVRIATYLKERSPSLVLAGTSAQSNTGGSQVVAAANALNILLGNVGKTIEAETSFPVKTLAPRRGSSAALASFAKGADTGAYEVAFIYNTNPLYSAPAGLELNAKLAKVGLKVALSMFPDETTLAADVVLPLSSPYEDWGTQVPAYLPSEGGLNVQQPLMQPLYSNVKGLGDILLALTKAAGAKDYDKYADFYAYLQAGFAAMPTAVKDGMSDADFWAKSRQTGFVAVKNATGSLNVKVGDLSQASSESASDFPLHLAPAARAGMYDGRNANLPWLQEQPDPITKIFWDSWAELHPKTAAKLGVKEGDFIRVESAHGSLEVQVYIYKGVHPDVVAVPMGRGHDEYGRFAKREKGVNPLKLIGADVDANSGELALYSTKVRVSNTGRSAEMPRLGGSESQAGRRIVSTVPADVYRRTEGGGNNVA